MTASDGQRESIDDVGRERPWAPIVRALTVNAPFLAFLLYHRLRIGENWYVSYRLPVLGELPSGALTDLTLFVLAVLLWAAMRRFRATRLLYLALAIPIGVLVMLFRLVDYYYYTSTHVPLNAYVLYGNLTMLEEGLGIVRASIGTLLIALIVGAHYLAYAVSARYAAALARLANRASASRRLLLPVAVAAAAVMLLNAHAIMVHPGRSATIKSLTAEYQFVVGLGAFLQEENATRTSARAVRPARLYLPLPSTENAGLDSAVAARRRPDIFVVTVESFNALYAVPPAELNPALTEDVMPFFRSLDTAGFQFSNAYTSSAYTFNGIVSVLCSQFTISETVWGRDCLPEVLRRAGYDAFAFISIRQLRPYRYDNFRAMGFDRDKVFDAIGMRRGKKNVLFSFMVDKELFDYAAAVADSVARAPHRKPIFAHIATNQMHVPGYFQNTSCEPYPFPADLTVDAQTRNMLNSARCTDRDLREFLAHLRRSGLYDESLIIITADHAFNISFWGHAESELARVPLFLKLPKSDTTTRHVDTAQLAAHLDIAPTIADYLGLRSARPMYGRSLLRADSAASRRHVVGISSSRLLSLATRSGVSLHVHGRADGTDPALRSEMESLFETVLYFDQQSETFEQLARDADARSRWSVASATAARVGAPKDSTTPDAEHRR
jgi:phosphoglycerol transferase MdoB-like AlkP superfamily enzyme